MSIVSDLVGRTIEARTSAGIFEDRGVVRAVCLAHHGIILALIESERSGFAIRCIEFASFIVRIVKKCEGCGEYDHPTTMGVIGHHLPGFGCNK